MEHVTVPEGDVIPEGSINVMIYDHDTDRGVYEVIVGWAYKEEIEHTFSVDMSNVHSISITAIDGLSVSDNPNLISQVAQDIHEAYIFYDRFAGSAHNIILHALYGPSKVCIYPWTHSTTNMYYEFKCLPSYITGVTPSGYEAMDLALRIYTQSDSWVMSVSESGLYLGYNSWTAINQAIDTAVNTAIGNAIGGSY